VSFADPVPRRTAGGDIVCPGHVGITRVQRRRGRVGGLRLPYPKRADLDHQLELWTPQP
jgi:hypothetical protein